jgi:hypothetical protein
MFEKNYRLQDIQLSKNPLKQSLAFSIQTRCGPAVAKATAGILRS